MKKIRVKPILFLVVSAMAALLFIQVFQLIHVFNKKSAEFNDRFSMTLERISLSHEKAEDIRHYLKIANKNFGVQYKDLLKEEFKNLLSAEESISIQDTSIFENNQLQHYLIIKGRSYDSISGVTAEQKVLARDIHEIRDLFHSPGHTNHNPAKLEVQLNERVMQKVMKKASFVNNMMMDIFRSERYEDASKRLDVAFLDSALTTELKLENIPDKFEYMVVDSKLNPVQFDQAPKNYSTTIDTSKTHKTRLFPTNSFDEELFLFVHFPRERAFVLRGMWLPLLMNLSLLALIVIALIFMFRTILSQKKLSEMKSDFISNMTHEFKTPISTISLACQAMNDEDMVKNVNKETQPYVNMINEENKRLGKLVERILQSATLEKGELKLNSEPIILNELVEHVAENAQFRVMSSGGEIRTNTSPTKIQVNGDRMHIRNLISNLVDNAIKYSEGSPKVTVDLCTDGGQTKLMVTDEGIGIKKEHLNKIFDKLYRIPTGNVHNVKGFGLGLSYVKAVAELHGWDIQVKSKLGVGSTFTIVIKE